MISVLLDLSKEEWIISEQDSDSSGIAFGFCSDQERTDFDNLSYGWTLYVNNEEVDSQSYPEDPSIIYVSTDQNHMSYDSISVGPEDNCTLSVWAKNSGVKYNDSLTWVVSRPEPIYSSWVWDTESKSWQAPVPMPDDGKQYSWDETSNSWLIYGLED